MVTSFTSSPTLNECLNWIMQRLVLEHGWNFPLRLYISINDRSTRLWCVFCLIKQVLFRAPLSSASGGVVCWGEEFSLYVACRLVVVFFIKWGQMVSVQGCWLGCPHVVVMLSWKKGNCSEKEFSLYKKELKKEIVFEYYSFLISVWDIVIVIDIKHC